MALEKPPFVTGQNAADIAKLRDYLFRLARTLETQISAAAGGQSAAVQSPAQQSGRTGGTAETDLETLRKAAAELKSLIVKTSNDVKVEASSRLAGDSETLASANDYTDGKLTVYDERYVAQSEYGTFKENISREVQENAAGTAENYRMITELDAGINGPGGLAEYVSELRGEILRGIVYDPGIQDYVVGIAISQVLNVKATMSPGAQAAIPDSNTYYELEDHQTFGLYTSTGWQFWIDGAKVAWLDSLTAGGMLHVSNVQVETRIVNGGYWEEKTENVDGKHMYVINYIGG